MELTDFSAGLDDDVLIELGRLTIAAVCLEDAVYGVCRSIRPRHGPSDDWPISSRINEASEDLESCPPSTARAGALAWLAAARDALERRNAVMHAVPVVVMSIPGTTPLMDAPEQWLSHVPRKKDAPVVHIRLTVEGLQPLRLDLERARTGWIDIATHAWDCYPSGT
jgi:hypothetical protein